MKKKILGLMLSVMVLFLVACGGNKEKTSEPSNSGNAEITGKIVIYTSMYEDIIDNVSEKLKKEFPNLEVEFFQGGTGTLQSKIIAELQANKLGCDMLMVAEPSYSLELKEKGILHAYISKNAENIALDYDKEGYWYPVRLLNMILAYNPEKYKKEDLALTFADFSKKENLKGKISIPDPLKSGTALAAVSALTDKYGEEYFKDLANQKVVVESGSVAVTKLETGEAAQIMILEESILKKREEENSSLEVIYPEDGIISIPSTIMTVKEEMSANKNTKAAELLTDWFLSPVGQEAIVQGWMHSVLKNPEKMPFDAKATADILKQAMPVDWQKTYHDRESLRKSFETNITKAK
ncbi:MAG: ABC transporter substrate-binding protein [Fusobacterium sp.]|uniref:ABC transporter substrate-binding protein n=1 Tax=Fusobacterium sp. TaxID=68766 RepID=UPI0026DC1642|nr:ABC transporter substrate-binding protein [Fusobacterium sp.]MDO4690513.1 ABC transporter substrate-binding protein [Fusobacterium sp.]